MSDQTVKKTKITIACDGSGDFSAETVHMNGMFIGLFYKPDGSAPLPSTADLTIVGAVTAFPYYAEGDVGTVARVDIVETEVVNETGTAVSGVTDKMPIDEKLTVTIANGGASDAGEIWLYWV